LRLFIAKIYAVSILEESASSRSGPERGRDQNREAEAKTSGGKERRLAWAYQTCPFFPSLSPPGKVIRSGPVITPSVNRRGVQRWMLKVVWSHSYFVASAGAGPLDVVQAISCEAICRCTNACFAGIPDETPLDEGVRA
jgi:hypothetical protein